jgi:integrase
LSRIREFIWSGGSITPSREWLTVRLLSAATADEADLIKFLLETGVRDKEAAHVDWDDIDGNYLQLKDKPKYDWRPKHKEIRAVPLNSKLIARLKARRLRQEAQAKEDGRDVPTLIFPNSLNRPNLALDETIQRVVSKANPQTRRMQVPALWHVVP